MVWEPAGHHHHREPSAHHVGGGHAWEREGGELLVNRGDPGPGSRRSSLEKPSRTRAGGRGERRGVLHCLEEKEKNKSWVNARILSSLNHRETKSLSKKKAPLVARKKSVISSPSRILDVPTKLFVSETLILF